MPYTPDTATEIDSYQGNPTLAIGQSGNLPFFPTMSPEVVNQFTAITDAYVKKKQKDYDQWQTNLTKAKNETIGMEGVYQPDTPEIQKKQGELEALLAKDPTVVAVGAERNNPNYKKFIELEKDLLYSKRLSEHHAELDKEYKRLSTQKAFQNDAFRHQWDNFKSTPISERTPFIPIQDESEALQTNVEQALKSDIYQNPLPVKVTPEYDVNNFATGSTIRSQDYTLNNDAILATLMPYNKEIDSYNYDNGIGLSDEEKAMTKDEYHKAQILKKIPQGVFHYKNTYGVDAETRALQSVGTYEQKDAIRREREARGKAIKDADDAQKNYDKKVSELSPKVGYILIEASQPMSVKLKPETKVDVTKFKELDLIPALKGKEIYNITKDIESSAPNYTNAILRSLDGNLDAFAVVDNKGQREIYVMNIEDPSTYKKVTTDLAIKQIANSVGKEDELAEYQNLVNPNSSNSGAETEVGQAKFIIKSEGLDDEEIERASELAMEKGGVYNEDTKSFEFDSKKEAQSFLDAINGKSKTKSQPTSIKKKAVKKKGNAKNYGL